MDSELSILPCLACGSPELRVVLTPEDMAAEQEWLRRFHSRRMTGDEESLKDLAEFTQSEAVYLTQCGACGTLMRNPQPTPASLRRKYRFDTYGRRTLRQLLANEEAFFEGKAASIAHRIPDGGAVLEIGCFVGAFLQACEARGWRGVGVDIGIETCAFVRENGLCVVEGDVLDLPDEAILPREGMRFDAVCIWNTFDQVNRPSALLSRLRTLLAPGGLLVLRVPNGAFTNLDIRT